MKYSEAFIKGVWIIEPKRFGDKRGYFMETFRLHEFRMATGAEVTFVQDNESGSTRGVLRGLHFQRGSHSQAKLVRVTRGKVLDVAVDLRPGSPTFGRHMSVELSEENACQIFIPRYFAHGFLVLSDEARFQYKVDNYYCPQAEATLRFDDPALAIEWPRVEGGYNVSQKDISDAISLREAAAIISTDLAQRQ